MVTFIIPMGHLERNRRENPALADLIIHILDGMVQSATFLMLAQLY